MVPKETARKLRPVAVGDKRADLPYVALMDDAGRTRIDVTFDEAGEPAIRMMDDAGRATYMVPPAYGVEMLER